MVDANTSLAGFEGAKEAVDWACRPPVLMAATTAALALLLAGYRRLAKPVLGGVAALAAVGALLLGLQDANFRSIVAKPDNVAIIALVFALGFFLGRALRSAAMNDRRRGQVRPDSPDGDDGLVLTWPDLVYVELIAVLLATAVLIVWAILLPAPLEQPADPNWAPNPAKAPWYFLGLQEMLVYFDPWLAGVVFPGLIILGLLAIPYIDRNPRGNGYYTVAERPFAVSTFLFGFVVLGVLFIVIGTFLRGPNWSFYGPFEFWDPHRPGDLAQVELSSLFWVDVMGGEIPGHCLVRELPGIVLLGLYFLSGPLLLRLTVLRRIYRSMGFIRYSIMTFLLLAMLLLPIKMVLRWSLNLHYIIGLGEWSMNI